MRIDVVVNGRRVGADVEPRRLLADFLREDLSLSGTHVACEHGACGACTVLLDGEPVRSCIMLAAQADGASIETVEGLAADGELHPLQEAFSRHHALQCGFCTPGFLMTSTYVLRQDDGTTEDEQALREALGGHLCRCTGYHAIVDAVMETARAEKERAL